VVLIHNSVLLLKNVLKLDVDRELVNVLMINAIVKRDVEGTTLEFCSLSRDYQKLYSNYIKKKKKKKKIVITVVYKKVVTEIKTVKKN